MSEYLLIALGVAALALYGYFRWQEMSKLEREELLEDLVQAAQQKFDPKQNQDKYQYVLTQLKQRYPWLPVSLAEALIEAEVYRQKTARIEPILEEPPASPRWN